MNHNVPEDLTPKFSRKDLATPITDAFLKAFATGQVLIDCPRIVVRQLATLEPQTFNGRGMLTLLADEEFQLRMYVDGDSDVQFNPLDELLKVARWRPGEIIPPEEYYELVATDLSGFEWTCSKIQVKRHSGQHGTVITGRLFDALRHRMLGLTGTRSSLLSMYFFDDLRVPYTTLVSTETSIGDSVLSSSLHPMMARVDAGDFHFQVEKTSPEKGSTLIRVTSHGDSWPEAIETRVEEALRYVTLSPLQWCVFEKRAGTTREVAVVPRRAKERAVFDEPLDHLRRDCAGDFWQLFASYFRHVIGHPDAKTYHPLSAQLFHVISAGTRQLDLMGLLVSVAVEGVLNHEYADVAKPPVAFIAQLDQVAKVIKRLRCGDAVLAARLGGVLGPMKSSRPKDKFKVLEERGIVTKDMIKAWEKLRNTTAHAAIRFDPAESGELFMRCQIVYTMLNRLVFQAIGYSGKYQDFGTLGWPIKDFKASLEPL